MKQTIAACLLGALAMTKGAGPVAAQEPPPVFSIRYELSRDRFSYRFENRSAFNTAELVPHEFTQTYWGDNQWLAVQARYLLGINMFESEVAATPQRTTRGDDFDTFFQPDGDVVIAGTTGNVSLRSLRFRESMVVWRGAGLHWRIGYQYRRDRSVFHAGQVKISHTNPPSVERSITNDREVTISENHEVRFGVSRSWNPTSGWLTKIDVDAAPAAQARLTTILPDKYPGREIVFTANTFSLNPVLTVTYGERLPLSFTFGYTQTFNYDRSRQFERNAVTVGVGIGTGQ